MVGRIFIRTLDAIATGSRDPALADATALTYEMAAEILLLLDTLNGKMEFRGQYT